MNYKIVENIRYLCKVNSIRISCVEKQIGVSAGYFSRLSKSIVNMSVDKLYKVSKIFNVSMNDIVERPLYKEDRIKQLKLELEKLEKED